MVQPLYSLLQRKTVLRVSLVIFCIREAAGGVEKSAWLFTNLFRANPFHLLTVAVLQHIKNAETALHGCIGATPGISLTNLRLIYLSKCVILVRHFKKST